MSQRIAVKTHLEEDQPVLLLQADTKESGGDIDILHRFIKLLDDTTKSFNVVAFLSEELVVDQHELPERFHDLKEINIKDVPPAFKKEKVNILIRLIDKPAQ